tara:strand:- start:246 stop:506 length:261 start_codon:yes stop_codon:yes gene_type:complete
MKPIHVNILRLASEILNFTAVVFGFYAIIHVSTTLHDTTIKKEVKTIINSTRRSKNYAIVALVLYSLAFVLMCVVHYFKISGAVKK